MTGCCFSKRKMEIEITDAISKDSEFDYLRPKGRLILKWTVYMMFQK